MKRIAPLIFIVFIQFNSYSQNAVRISPPGASYIDPEIFNLENMLSFQSSTGDVWLANIDSLTGLFISHAGLDLLIDMGAVPLLISMNGPEFGFDSLGWAIFYTKYYFGTPQIWKAVVNGTAVTKYPLTSGSASRLSTLATKSSSSESIRLLFSKGQTLSTGVIGWIDENNPSNEIIVDSIDSGVRWIDNSRKFVYTKQTGEYAGQLFLYDTETQSEERITNDNYRKTYSYGWFSPEYNNLVLLTVINDTLIGIYKDNGNQFWEKITDIQVPPMSSYNYFGSPEPFVAGNKSYISLVIKETPTSSSYVNAEVWVIGIEPNINNRFMLRTDDGIPQKKRTDPESYIGEEQVYIYYNLVNAGNQFEVWRYATGISTNPTGIINKEEDMLLGYELEQNYPNPFNPVTKIRFDIAKSGFTELKIFNIIGQEVRTIVNENLQYGSYEVEFDGSKLPTGIYFCRMTAGSFLKTIKIILTK